VWDFPVVVYEREPSPHCGCHPIINGVSETRRTNILAAGQYQSHALPFRFCIKQLI
jgi:hypothetical protein